MATTDTPTPTVIRSSFHPDVENYEQVNRDADRLLTKPGKGYLALLGMAIGLVLLMVVAGLFFLVRGIRAPRPVPTPPPPPAPRADTGGKARTKKAKA